MNNLIEQAAATPPQKSSRPIHIPQGFLPSTIDRLLDKCSPEPNTGCWLWTAGVNPAGYGRMTVGSRANGTKKAVLAHKLSYEIFVGPVSDGLILDHLCRVRCCVNPDHLEPVTHRENILRGVGASAKHARATHCKYGHEFNEKNTRIYLFKGLPRRICMECAGIKARAARSLYVPKYGPRSQEHRDKLSAAQMDFRHSAESRRKMSETQKERWAKK